MKESLEFFTFQNDAVLDKKVPIDQPEIVSEDDLEKENFHKMAGFAVQAMPVNVMKALVQEIGRENLPVFQRAAEMAYEENYYKFNENDFEDLKSVDVFASTAEYLAVDLLHNDHLAWQYFNKAKELLGHPDMSGQQPDIAKASSLAVQAMPVPLMQGLVRMIGQEKIPVFEKAVEIAYESEAYDYATRHDKVYDMAMVAENLAFDMLHANRRGLQYFERALELFGKGEQKETSFQIEAYRIQEDFTLEEFKRVAKPGQVWRILAHDGLDFDIKVRLLLPNLVEIFAWRQGEGDDWKIPEPWGGGIGYTRIVGAKLLEDVVRSSLEANSYRTGYENIPLEEFKKVVQPNQRWHIKTRFHTDWDIDIEFIDLGLGKIVTYRWFCTTEQHGEIGGWFSIDNITSATYLGSVEASLQTNSYRTTPTESEYTDWDEFIKVVKHGQKWFVKTNWQGHEEYELTIDRVLNDTAIQLLAWYDTKSVRAGTGSILPKSAFVSARLLQDATESSLKSLAYRTTPENLTGEEFVKVAKPGQKWRVTFNFTYDMIVTAIRGDTVEFGKWKEIGNPQFLIAGGISEGNYHICYVSSIKSATLIDDVVEGRLSTFADLYFNELFTVVPKKHDMKLGVLPDDQGFSKKYVFAWSSVRDLIHFKDDRWKKISFKLPKHGKQDLLTPLVGGAYALSSINSQWHLEEKKGISLYE
jgi:hypothetical protein